MKRARFLIFVVPALFYAGTFLGSLGLASAADGRGGGARQGAVYRGGGDRGGSRSYSSPQTGVWQRGGTSRGDYYRGGDYGRRGGYGRHGGYYGGSGYRHGGYGYHDHGHSSTSFYFGPSWGWSFWDPFYYPYYPSYYRYPYPYYGPSTTVVVPQEPQEYIMKAPAQQEETRYWYYCKEAKGYYPYVERCPGGWMKVIPQEPPDADEE